MMYKHQKSYFVTTFRFVVKNKHVIFSMIFVSLASQQTQHGIYKRCILGDVTYSLTMCSYTTTNNSFALSTLTFHSPIYEFIMICSSHFASQLTISEEQIFWRTAHLVPLNTSWLLDITIDHSYKVRRICSKVQVQSNASIFSYSYEKRDKTLHSYCLKLVTLVCEWGMQKCSIVKIQNHLNKCCYSK